VVLSKKTPVAGYHDQRKALKAVAFLAMECSECGITRDRSAGPEFLAFFAGLSWNKLSSHGLLPSSGEGFLESRSLRPAFAFGPCGSGRMSLSPSLGKALPWE
jgi:hypothetical protein